MTSLLQSTGFSRFNIYLKVSNGLVPIESHDDALTGSVLPLELLVIAVRFLCNQYQNKQYLCRQNVFIVPRSFNTLFVPIPAAIQSYMEAKSDGQNSYENSFAKITLPQRHISILQYSADSQLAVINNKSVYQ